MLNFMYEVTVNSIGFSNVLLFHLNFHQDQNLESKHSLTCFTKVFFVFLKFQTSEQLWVKPHKAICNCQNDFTNDSALSFFEWPRSVNYFFFFFFPMVSEKKKKLDESVVYL